MDLELNADQIEAMVRARVADVDAKLAALRAERERLNESIRGLTADRDKLSRMLPRQRRASE